MPAKKLLVADDSLTIQKVIRLALTNEGYEIQTVPDGTDAVEQISLFRPDLVLIDVSLPGKSAFEVKAEINQLEDLEEVRFILMSSAFEEVDEAQVEKVRFHGRLTKPFDPAHLRQVLTESLEQVTAKRMEKTSFTTRPALETPPPPPKNTPETVSIFPPLSALSKGPPTPPPFNGPKTSSKPDTPDILKTAVPPPPPFSEMPGEPIGFHDSIEDDLNPIHPINQGSLDPTSPERVASLWEPGEDLTSSLIPPPPPPHGSGPSPSHVQDSHGPDAFSEEESSDFPKEFDGKGSESDIRTLTESTIRISGLDDYEWSVNEPTLKPFPSMADMEGSTFQVEPPNGGESAELNGMAPFNPEIAEERGTPSIPKETLPPHPAPKEKAEESLSDEYSSSEPSTSRLDEIDSAQVEALVREQVQAQLQKMARELLPDMAEKIIKEEIHKMLSESS